MGLQSEVPLCNVKLSAPDAALLQVNSDDLMQLPKTPQVLCHWHMHELGCLRQQCVELVLYTPI